ncbi:NAD(P)-binding protein [Wolfiporia cocos MD-104 SS10]|uniref:NAD(P)-binding protein n=1 Tax=Wolfiporia cocos (strain MD-104) TaxID=742152 RepID=A0A2H3K897_WOLCO|nr:NAD(P)-binding protein [Wolfiporia cocos MD-104 SS10]
MKEARTLFPRGISVRPYKADARTMAIGPTHSDMSSAPREKKLILVLGATGAQGIAVIDKLLAPDADGLPSPYAVRAFTRDPNGERARALAARGVECVQGDWTNFASVAAALSGVYGAWVNTDGTTVNEMTELWCGVRIFELAQQAGVRHCVYSAQDYEFGLGNWDPKYRCHHMDGKGYVADWMKSQPSVVSDTGMTWSIVCTSPYMEMFYEQMFGPVKRRDDGTLVFAAPIGDGRMPIIALADVGYFARYTLDNRTALSGTELRVASDSVSWAEVAETFARLTGQKAEYVPLSEEQWFGLFRKADRPFAGTPSIGEGPITWQENFSAWWAMGRDNLLPRDLEWVRRIHPGAYTLERWMKENKYGEDEDALFQWQRGGSGGFLKDVADGATGMLPLNFDNVAKV